MTDLRLRCQKWRAEIGHNAAGAITVNLYATASFVGHLGASCKRLARQLAADATARWKTKASAHPSGAVVYPGLEVEREDVERWCRELGLLG